MATYIYETSKDEESALDLEVIKVNGQLASQNQGSIDKPAVFKLIVADKLKPLAQQLILAKVSPVIQKFIEADEGTRVKILEAVSTASSSDVVVP